MVAIVLNEIVKDSLERIGVGSERDRGDNMRFI